MRRSIKKFIALASAAIIAGGALSLTACGSEFAPPKGSFPAEGAAVVSNGGFVVEKGEYYYFINGIETYDADNTYGVPVKGALMRAKKESGGWKTAETVIPSLMVDGSHTGGLFIYGDRIYYATPTNVKGIDGTVQNSYLDFASAKLDGTDRKELVRVSSNSTEYRFIEENGTVYLVYCDSSASTKALHSYNTATGVDTVLAEGLGDLVFHKTEKGNAAIYYTMTVTDKLDSSNPKSYADAYNQIYCVTAAATEEPYEYQWDQDWLNENNEGKVPYINLGTLVLDGIGATQPKTSFNHGTATPSIPGGYTYTLRSFENDGIYFTRRQTDMETTGVDDALFYLPISATASGWDSIGGNDTGLQCVANAVYADSKASASALFFMDKEGGHHYLYTDEDGIYRVDATETGGIKSEIQIARDASGATLVSLDPIEGNDEYAYVYYTLSVNSNLSVNRAVYDNKAGKIEQRFYANMEDANFDLKNEYTACRVLDIVHATGWYNFEIIGADLFFADADAVAYGSAVNCISCVDLTGANGLMNNAEIKALNAKLHEITGYDDGNEADSLLEDISKQQEEDVLSNAVKYYFYTGTDELLKENAAEYEAAIEANEQADGDEDITNPYAEDFFKAFNAYVNGEELTYNGNTYTLKDGEKSYRTRSYFVTKLGVLTADEEEAVKAYWKGDVLSEYTAPETEEAEGLAGWEIALIVCACVAAVAGAAAAVTVVLLKKKKKANAPKTPRMHVDTTDDKDIDVYADDEPTPEDELVEEYEAPAEEPEQEIPTEEPEEQEEQPSQETEQPSDDRDPYNE